MFGAIRRLLPWFATTALSLVLILVSRDREASRLGGKVNDLVAVGSYPFASGLKIANLWAENRRLRRELVDQKSESNRSAEIYRENDRLRKLLEFRSRSTMQLTAAEVVGFTADEGVRGLLVNRGLNDGILASQAVITPEGLVGRVYRVYENSAAIQLIGDPNLGVAAKLVNAQESGIIHASVGGSLKLDGVPVSAATGVGDSVVTSGQGGVFPSGLLIGFTTRVVPSPEGWLLNVEVSPSVDMHRLEEVFIIRSSFSLD